MLAAPTLPKKKKHWLMIPGMSQLRAAVPASEGELQAFMVDIAMG